MEEKINPRALNLERLNTEKNKITLGFKCAPKLKLQLANEARKINITLSEYVESIVQNYSTSDNQANQVSQTESLIKPLQQKIQFYENDILKELFSANRGKTLGFKNAKGEDMSISISSIQDIYTVLINSFKTSKQ